MITQTNEQATMTLNANHKRIGYYAEHRQEQVIWSPDEWERPYLYCRNDLLDMPGIGIGRVVSVHSGIEIEVVRRMMV